MNAKDLDFWQSRLREIEALSRPVLHPFRDEDEDFMHNEFVKTNPYFQVHKQSKWPIHFLGVRVRIPLCYVLDLSHNPYYFFCFLHHNVFHRLGRRQIYCIRNVYGY